jgi:hypothetical protein
MKVNRTEGKNQYFPLVLDNAEKTTEAPGISANLRNRTEFPRICAIPQTSTTTTQSTNVIRTEAKNQHFPLVIDYAEKTTEATGISANLHNSTESVKITTLYESESN